jgi:hypothetical protein
MNLSNRETIARLADVEVATLPELDLTRSALEPPPHLPVERWLAPAITRAAA